MHFRSDYPAAGNSGGTRRLGAGCVLLGIGLLVAANDFAPASAAPPEMPAKETDSEFKQIIRRSRSAADQLEKQGLNRAVIEEQRQVMELMQALINSRQSPGSQAAGAGSRMAADSAGTSSQPPAAVPDSAGSAANSAGGPSVSDSSDPASSLRNAVRLQDAVWGHLPSRERDPLIRAFNEQYVPEYEQQVRAYFEALARRPRKD